MSRLPITRQASPAEGTASGAAFVPSPGPPLAELEFDGAYRRYRLTEAEQRVSERRL